MASRSRKMRQAVPALVAAILCGLWLACPEPTFEGRTADEWAIEIHRDLAEIEEGSGQGLSVWLVGGISFMVVGSLDDFDVQLIYGPSCNSLRSLEEGGAAAGAVITGLLGRADPEIRCLAACVVARRGVDGRLRIPDAHRRLLRVMLGDVSALVRRAGVVGLAAIGRTDADGPSILAALADPAPEVRSEACLAFTRLDPPVEGTIPALRAAPRDESVEVRATAAKGLARLSVLAAPAVPDLARRVDDVSGYVALQALEALGAIGPGAREAVPVLIVRQDRLTRGVLRALGRIGEPRATGTLLEAVRQGDSDARRTALTGLERLARTDRALIEPIIDALTDEDEQVRRQACWVLSKVEPGAEAARARPLLRRVMESASPVVRAIAAQAVVAYGGDVRLGLGALLDILRTRDGLDARFATRLAAHVLGDLGPLARRAVAGLEEIRRARPGWVSDAIAQALRRIRGENAE